MTRSKGQVAVPLVPTSPRREPETITQQLIDIEFFLVKYSTCRIACVIAA
jgi:hypothetical protein